MNRKKALEELLAKVRVGEGQNDGCMFRAFGDKWTHCFDAYYGSLDAAKALHEAVLPEWEYGVTKNIEQPDGPCAFVAEWGSEIQFLSCSTNPARAWLVAILEALISLERKE